MNMTQQELRELDAWIAVNVMAWVRRTNKNFENYSEWQWQMDGGKVETASRMNMPFRYFSPTADLAAAMVVLEKCVKNVPYSLDLTHDKENGYCFWFLNSEATEVFACAETMPLAICLFAKKLFTK